MYQITYLFPAPHWYKSLFQWKKPTAKLKPTQRAIDECCAHSDSAAWKSSFGWLAGVCCRCLETVCVILMTTFNLFYGTVPFTIDYIGDNSHALIVKVYFNANRLILCCVSVPVGWSCHHLSLSMGLDTQSKGSYACPRPVTIFAVKHLYAHGII